MAVFVGDDHGRAHRPCRARAHQPQELQLSGMSLPNTRHSQPIQKTHDFLVPSYKTAGPINIPSNHPKPQALDKEWRRQENNHWKDMKMTKESSLVAFH